MEVASFLIGYQAAQNAVGDKVDPYYQKLAEALMLREANYISDDPTVLRLENFVTSQGTTLASINSYAFAGFKDVEFMKFTDIWMVTKYAFAGCNKLKILDITVPEVVGAIGFEPNSLSGCDALEAVIIRCDGYLENVSFQTSATADGHGSNSKFYVYVPASDYDSVIKDIGESSSVPADRFRKLEDYPVIDRWGQSFTIRFYNGDELLSEQILGTGEMPICEEPTKEGFVFDGWDPELSVAVADVDYYAKWDDSIASGDLSDSVKWRLKATGEMIVSGTGAVPDASTSPDYKTYATQITSLRIENGITHIGRNAFASDFLPNLTQVVMADSVLSIGIGAFQNHTKLTSVKLSANLESIGDYAFRACSVLSDITIPATVKTIGQYAFYRDYAITGVDIPSGVTVLSTYVFGECSNLASITIPATVKKIEAYALYSTALTSAVFEDSSGWYSSTSADATSGTSMTFSDPATAASRLKNYTYRKYYYFDPT